MFKSLTILNFIQSLFGFCRIGVHVKTIEFQVQFAVNVNIFNLKSNFNMSSNKTVIRITYTGNFPMINPDCPKIISARSTSRCLLPGIAVEVWLEMLLYVLHNQFLGV